MHYTSRTFANDQPSVHLLLVAVIISIFFPAQFVAGAAGKQTQKKRITNGASLNPIPVKLFQSPVTTFTSVINLPTNNLVFNSQTQKIHASVPGSGGAIGNSMTDIDPFAATLGQLVLVAATSLTPRW